MPNTLAHPVRLSARQRRVLEQLVRRPTTPQHLATRARILLAAAAGESNRALARRLGITRDTAQTWRAQWAAAGEALLAAELEGGADDDRALDQVIRGVLADAPRPGAPATFTPEQLCQLIALACTPPGDSGRPLDHWTARELADEAGKRGIVARISARTVGRLLVVGGGRPAAPPEPVLADARTRGPGRLRRAGGGGV